MQCTCGWSSPSSHWVPGEVVIPALTAAASQWLTLACVLPPAGSLPLVSFPTDLSVSVIHIVFPTRLCVYVSPVLTPPESEKADSEDRVSLKVCSQHFFLPSLSSWNLLQNIQPFLRHAVSSVCAFLSLSDSKTSRGSLHPHLCGPLQVPASGEGRPGATVSLSSLCTVCVRVIRWIWSNYCGPSACSAGGSQGFEA